YWTRVRIVIGQGKMTQLLPTRLHPSLPMSASLLACSVDGRFLFIGGSWDGSLRVAALPRGKLLHSVYRHVDVVTCLSLDSGGEVLVTGSRDSTCVIWELVYPYGIEGGSISAPKPVMSLLGHESEVTAVAVNVDLDLVVSGAKVIGRLGVKLLQLSYMGHILVYSEATDPCDTRLDMYSITGRHLKSWIPPYGLSVMMTAADHLILGDQRGNLGIREIQMLSPVTSLPVHRGIACLAVAEGSTHILCSLSNGKVVVCIVDQSEPLPSRGHDVVRRRRSFSEPPSPAPLSEDSMAKPSNVEPPGDDAPFLKRFLFRTFYPYVGFDPNNWIVKITPSHYPTLRWSGGLGVVFPWDPRLPGTGGRTLMEFLEDTLRTYVPEVFIRDDRTGQTYQRSTNTTTTTTTEATTTWRTVEPVTTLPTVIPPPSLGVTFERFLDAIVSLLFPSNNDSGK
ncbi:unnamed protein product, partial [Cyprideis torosa]